MFYRIILFLVGLSLATYGIMCLIIYLSYLNINYTITDFFHIITTNFEIILFPIGLIIMLIACFGKFKFFKKTNEGQ